jgi:enoyl-CoA hydratase/carnithine racemase
MKKERASVSSPSNARDLNVLNRKVFCELNEFITILENDDGIGPSSSRGGEWAFSAGADVTELAALDGAGPRLFRLRRAVLRKLEKMEKPVIAAINGYAWARTGTGPRLRYPCRVGYGPFGCPETGLGSIPASGHQRFPAGRGRLRQRNDFYRLSHRFHEALRRGLVNRVVPRGSLWKPARPWPRKCSKSPPRSRL